MNQLLTGTAVRAARYVEGIPTRRVLPLPESIARLEGLGGPLLEDSCDPATLIALLDDLGSPATVATTGGRYFGFVTGGALPGTLAANWLAGAWDQNGALTAMSPVAAKIEEITLAWLRDVLELPESAGAGFVTGGTMANFTGLAAARHALLDRAGWDVEDKGMFGAPEITVIVGGEVHIALLKALSMLGFGRTRVVTVPADDQGRMKADEMPAMNDRTIVCMQAGNVNSGAFDPASEICARAHQAGAWVHVDGAFGMWAAAAPGRRHLTSGVCDADSWATDCHKWLNVPFDSGLAFVRDPESLRAALAVRAAYLSMADDPGAIPLHAGSIASGSRHRSLGRLEILGPQRIGRNDRTQLPLCYSLRRRSESSRIQDPERRSSESGHGFVWGCRQDPARHSGRPK